MNSFRVLLALLLAVSWLSAAELYALRMEIAQTPEGQATIFRDSVVITDGGTRIDAHLARMYRTLGVAVISESVVIRSPDALIRADSARYYLGDKRTELFGNVRVRRESLDIESPTLLYRSRERSVRADSGVVLTSFDRSYRLAGRRGAYDMATDIGLVDSLPVLTWLRGDDSARVTSRRMQWYERESRAAADGAVRLSSGASTVTCDSAVFFSGADTGLAWGSPEMRDSASRATGDTMRFRVRDGALEQVTIRDNAVGEYRTQGGDRIAVRGSSILLSLAGGSVDRIEIVDMSSGQLIRANRATEEQP